MSYVLKCWNWNFRRISNLYFLLNFQLKKKTVKEFCILWHLQAIRCLNSKEIMLKSSIRVTCTFYRSDFFFCWKWKRKQRFKIRCQLQYSTPISTLWIWHDPQINQEQLATRSKKSKIQISLIRSTLKNKIARLSNQLYISFAHCQMNVLSIGSAKD